MRICKEKITDEIRDLFGANPLKVPEARILPLCMLEIIDNSPKYLGMFKFLVEGNFEFDLAIHESPVAQISNVKTKKVDFSIGLNILGNFIKAFGMDPASIGASIKGASKMAFAFGNVTRKYIDVLELGKILIENDLKGDSNNIIVSKIMKNKHAKLALITDTLMSTDFSLSIFKENETGASIDIPLIQDYLAKVNTKLKVSKTSDNEITFSGDTPLTYAFSCVEITLDSSGKFSRGKWLDNIRNASSKKVDLSNLEIPKYMFDENMANPLLIEF